MNFLKNCCKYTYFTKSNEIEESIKNEENIRKLLSHKDDFGQNFFPGLRG